MKKLISITLCFILAITGCFAQTTVTVKKAGTLGTLLTQEQQDTCVSLIVCGKLNSEDIRVLRRMAGYAEGGKSGGALRLLDLRECKVEKSKTPYMVLDAKEEYLAGTGLPEHIQANKGVDIRSPYFQMVRSYSPMYLLGHDTMEKIKAYTYKYSETSSGVRSSVEKNGRKESVGDFQFAKGLSDEEWEEMKRMEMNKGKGFEIIQENGRYMLYAYTEKDKILHAAFYGCPHLKVLVIPDKAEMDFTIRDENTNIQFMQDLEKKK